MASTLCEPRIGLRPSKHVTGDRPAVAERIAALTELLARMQTAGTPDEACRIMADELHGYLECEQVVVGLCAEGSATCRVAAISNVDAVLPHSDKTRLAQAALHEAIARSEWTVWPAPEDSQRYALLAHARYAHSQFLGRGRKQSLA